MIDITSTYWTIGRKPFDECKKELLKVSKSDLVGLLMNDRYNSFVSDRADYNDKERPVDPTISNGHTHGKRIPYIGWFWRSTDFYNKQIAIGDCGEFIGIMENNKWGYPERNLTPEEVDKVIVIIESSMKADQAGGALNEIIENTHRELEKLWPLFQTFTI